MFVLLVGLVFSGYKIVDYFYTSYDEKQNFNNVEKLVESEYEDEKIQYNDFEILKKYKKVYEKNNDLVGWIKIKDTNIDYPVMQTKDDYSYYLKRNFNKKSSIYGTPFVGDGCGINPNSDNVIIYGHNMKNGSMFNNIKSYTEQDFADKHPYVYIYLPDGTVSRYKVVAAHIIPEESLLYNTGITDIQAFYQEMLKTSDIKVDFEQAAGNPVITLSTCTSAGSESGKRNVVHAVLDRAGIDPKTETMD